MIIDIQNLGNDGKDFALEAHREINQLYAGYLPYEFHLRLAAKVALEFFRLLNIPPSQGAEADAVMSAVWCHDVLEDTFKNYGQLEKAIGHQAAEIVYAVTNEKGRNRKERANERYYQGIRDTQYAVFVKLADRIANATYGKLFGDKLFALYVKEQEAFEKSLAGPQLDGLVPMLARLRNTLRG